MYQERISALLETYPDLKPDPVPEWAFVECVWPSEKLEPNQLEPLPNAYAQIQVNERLPYWIMRTLRKTMTQGGYFTSSLYVPKEIWIQPGARLQIINVKYEQYDNLLIWCQKLQALDLADLNALSKDLEEFDIQMNNIQNTLAKKLKYVDEARDSKAGKSILSKLSDKKVAPLTTYSVEDQTAYLKLIIKLFEAVDFFDAWQLHFASLPSTASVSKIRESLRRVAEFMFGVVCVTVMFDFRLLMDLHMKRQMTEMFAY